MANDAEPMAAVPDRFTELERRKKDSMEVYSPNLDNPDFMQHKLMGDVVKEKDVRISADINIGHGKLTLNGASSSFPTNDGVQPAFISLGNGDGHSTALPNFNARGGLDKGVAEEDGMEFDGRGKADAAF